MTKIGLVSDTHGHIDDKLLDFFSNCRQIWHAGDIGSVEVLETLSEKADIYAVYGNIDGQELMKMCGLNKRFKCENMNIWITHIGGYPGKYDMKIKTEIFRNPPDIFVSGHSHILKIIFDKKINCLHINPGAYGKYGDHVMRTAVRFDIDGRDVKNMEILEIKR